MKSSIQTKILTPTNNVVSVENTTYILIRNLGLNDAYLETEYGGRIFLPSGMIPMQIYAPISATLDEVWRANFPFGATDIHIVYIYHGKK